MYKKNNSFKNMMIIMTVLKLLQEQEKEIYIRDLKKIIYYINTDFQKNIHKEEILNKSKKPYNENSKDINNITTSNNEENICNSTNGLEQNKIKKFKDNIISKNINYKIKNELNEETYKHIKKKHNIKKLVCDNKKRNKYVLKCKRNNDNQIQHKNNIFINIPIVIADLQLELTDRMFTNINEGFLDINKIKNNIFIEEAYLMKLDFNSAKLFIKGYIRSYIEYITLEKLEDDVILTKTKGVIDYKDFNINNNMNFIFSSKLKEGKTLPIYFYSDFKGKDYLNCLRGTLEKTDIGSYNIYKPTIKNNLNREQTYLGIEQNFLIKISLHITENNVVVL